MLGSCRIVYFPVWAFIQCLFLLSYKSVWALGFRHPEASLKTQFLHLFAEGFLLCTYSLHLPPPSFFCCNLCGFGSGVGAISTFVWCLCWVSWLGQNLAIGPFSLYLKQQPSALLQSMSIGSLSLGRSCFLWFLESWVLLVSVTVIFIFQFTSPQPSSQTWAVPHAYSQPRTFLCIYCWLRTSLNRIAIHVVQMSDIHSLFGRCQTCTAYLGPPIKIWNA